MIRKIVKKNFRNGVSYFINELGVYVGAESTRLTNGEYLNKHSS